MTVFDDYLHRNIIRSGSTEKTDENIYFERKFRDFVMLWLADGKPKLFRSETEGNMIVMISGASFTPQDKSNRMVYNLSCTVTEIAEYNLENLINYNLIPFVF
jgi:CTP:phosphocholine cytidylyltransferase-like protein